MHFSIPETENLQDKEGSFYQVTLSESKALLPLQL
jgi:hypothetical protein